MTARAENLLHGRNDLEDTIRRLQAYEAAGADVLYAPGLRDLSEIRRVVGAISRPFNAVIGWLDPNITVAQLATAGVKRISVGGALSRLALANVERAARTMLEQGSIAWMRDVPTIADLRRRFSAR